MSLTTPPVFRSATGCTTTEGIRPPLSSMLVRQGLYREDVDGIAYAVCKKRLEGAGVTAKTFEDIEGCRIEELKQVV